MPESKPLISVVIRTFNEERYLEELLEAVSSQVVPQCEVETVIIDSGSTDNTLQIAARFNCRLTHIRQADFTFGRSLNQACEFAGGDLLVFISGHCIPCRNDWLLQLIGPLLEESADYTYGRQLGRDTTKFSERQHFRKYFPDRSEVPQSGYFCNNANAALTRTAWQRFRFDETLTGLEDLKLAKSIVDAGGVIGYVAEAPVYHIHDETWERVRVRYEREAVAMRDIEPRLHFTVMDFIRCTLGGIFQDVVEAAREGQLVRQIGSIVRFRIMQFGGTYSGHREHLKVSEELKREYFYPQANRMEKGSGRKHRCTVADEG